MASYVNAVHPATEAAGSPLRSPRSRAPPATQVACAAEAEACTPTARTINRTLTELYHTCTSLTLIASSGKARMLYYACVSAVGGIARAAGQAQLPRPDAIRGRQRNQQRGYDHYET